MIVPPSVTSSSNDCTKSSFSGSATTRINSATLLFSLDSATTLFLSTITLIKYSPLLSKVYLKDVEAEAHGVAKTAVSYNTISLPPETQITVTGIGL